VSIVWWEVETPDPDAFRHFHGAMWGWRFERAFQDSELNRDYWLIRDGEAVVGGLQRAVDPVAPHAGVRFYLEVEDLEERLRDAQERGARIERHRTELGGDDRWFANILDPSGVSVGLWTAAPPR
jgi:predicted enzyme related to lactoylglutathione lyase